jgi:hypothetical protein
MDLGGSCANLLLWIEGARVELVSKNGGGRASKRATATGFQPRLDFKRKHGYHFGAATHSP